MTENAQNQEQLAAAPEEGGKTPKAAPEKVSPPADETLPAAKPSAVGPAGQPVDNPLIEGDGSEPQQELGDADLPPEISPGAMGTPRATLVMELGFQGDHPFDAEVEEKLRLVAPDYDGTVTKDIWRKVLADGHQAQSRVTPD